MRGRIMRGVRRLALCLLGLGAVTIAATSTLHAQQAAAQQAAAQQSAVQDSDLPRRQLEQRLRQRLGVIVKRELKLDDAQAQRLGSVSAKYETERRQLAAQERELRLQLRDEMQGGDQANQDRVSRALDRMLEVQRKRLDIVQREQKELSTFLTPVQRAKYLALQDQVRRRLEEARRARAQDPTAAPLRPRRQKAGVPPSP